MTKELSREDILATKITTISEEDRFEDETKHPSKFFIINAFGEAIYFHTRSRLTAQQWCDKIYNRKDFFKVREVIKIGNRV